MVIADPASERAGAPAGGVGRDRGPVETWLAAVHDRHAAEDGGRVATYIPELATADPAWFGIAVATIDGSVHAVGDADVPFTIQSISKALTYGLVLELLGEEAVRARIGVEPTGDAFNAITLARATGTPLNPMVNAGAIAATGLLAGATGWADPLAMLLREYGRFAGRRLEVDERTYRSERETGHRNRAIGHLLRSSGALDGDPDRAVDLYFRACSVAVTTRDLAVIGATLAAGGRNPVTGEQVVRPATARSVLSVMATCGMYDGAGEWLYSVGLPAKSGVAGGVVAVLPGQLGIGVFSPPLDDHGNSVRGVRVCRDLSAELELHLVGARQPAVSPIRACYTLAEVGSKRLRPIEARERLAEVGGRTTILEVQGALGFLAVERLSIALGAKTGPLDALVLDLRRVTAVHRSAMPVLAALLAWLGGRRVRVELVLPVSADARHALETVLDSAEGSIAGRFGDLDRAIEAAEDAALGSLDDEAAVPLERHELLDGLDADQLERLGATWTRQSYESGQRIVAAGDPADDLFLIVAGRLSASIGLADGRRRRLTTLGPGMMFGEGALLGDRRRSADVDADGPVECLVLPVAAFERLVASDPAIGAVVHRNLARIVTATARRLTRELAVLAG